MERRGIGPRTPGVNPNVATETRPIGTGPPRPHLNPCRQNWKSRWGLSGHRPRRQRSVGCSTHFSRQFLPTSHSGSLLAYRHVCKRPSSQD